VTEQSSPEPGWYPDPSGSANLRWWNGVSWSDSTHPLPGAPAASAPPPAYPTIFGDEEQHTAAPGSRGPWRSIVLVVVLLAVAGIAVAFLLSAISSRALLDTANIEQQIAEKLSQDSGLTTTVTCPDEVTVAAGDTFTCTATTDDGRTAVIEVTQDDDQGTVTWSAVG
jgi:hypothetical protein